MATTVYERENCDDAMLKQISEGVRREKVPGDSLINSKNE